MKENTPKETGARMAKFWIWTIRNHDAIAGALRIYMFAAVAMILLLCIGGVIHLKAALVSILFGGLSICALVWIVIENRRTQLYHITDPKLRRQAHEAMMEFIYLRKNRLDKSKKRKHAWSRFLNKHRPGAF